MKSKFFTFLDPILKLLDNGRFFKQPFKWLYILLAALSLLAPIWLLAKTIDQGVFKYAPGSTICFFIIFFIIFCGIMWLNAQIWWNRGNKIPELTTDNDKFFTVPLYANFVQTLGESLGFITAATGFFVSLFTIFNDEFRYMLGDVPFSGFLGLIISIVYGFLIIIVARVIAELMQALISIANSTNKIDENTKKEEDSTDEKTTDETTVE